jgi:aminoglycoside phosphotransferase (APT) family kinase protein
MSKVLRNEYHDPEASKRLAAMHEERTSSPETISSIVREGISKDVLGYNRVIRGEVNEVYIVQPTKGEDIILRIAHRKTNKFEPEAWAIEQAARAGVPVPKVLAVGSFESETRPVYYSIQEQLMGKTFDNMLYVEHIDKSNTLVEAPHLVHHDYGPKHMFVSDADEIVGIIDFEDVASGDAAIDFSGWKFWFKEEVPLEWLLTGYQKVRPLGDNFEDRLRVAGLDRMLGLMNYYTNKAPYPKLANATAEALKELMEQK